MKLQAFESNLTKFRLWLSESEKAIENLSTTDTLLYADKVLKAKVCC